MNLKSGLRQNTGNHGSCDCAMWLSVPWSFLKLYFPHSWPVLPVHLRFNLKNFFRTQFSHCVLSCKLVVSTQKSDRICKGMSVFSLSYWFTVHRNLVSAQFDRMRLKRCIYKRQPFPQYTLSSLPPGGLCSRHLSVH